MTPAALTLPSVVTPAALSMPSVDTVIVGAGYAGLAAAHALHTAGADYVVLEAASRPGGRVRNYLPAAGEYDVVDDSAVEVGGTFVSPSHTALLAFAEAYDVRPYNTSQRRRRPALARVAEPAEAFPWWYWGVDTESSMGSSVLHTASKRVVFTTPTELKASLRGLAPYDELETVGKEMASAIAPLSCEAADSLWPEYDGVTFEGWIREHVTHEEGRAVLRAMCRGMIAQEPAQVSFLSTAKSLKGCWSAGDDDQFRLRGGTQAPLLRATAALGPKRVRLESPVLSVRALATAVEGGEGGERYEVATHERTYRARNVILTGSPPALLGIRLPPAMPSSHAQLLQRMPMGESAKLFLFYATPWWRAAGQSANIMSTGNTCMDHSAYDATRGSAALMCWLEGATNLAYFDAGNRTAATEAVLAFLEGALQDERVRAYTSSHVLNWPDDAWARGAYTGFFVPGVQSQPHFWRAYTTSEKLPGLFVAGADHYPGLGNGYMEGAVRSGEAAAATVLQRANMV